MLYFAFLSVFALQQLNADSLARADSLRRQQTVEVNPQVLRFTPGHTSAALEFRNPSDTTRQAEVRVEFTYPDWPHGKAADTTVISLNRDLIQPHDTTVLHPGPTDRYAGRWMSGVPTYVKLGPHETKRITVKLDPPATLPDGEYWARIATIVRASDPRHGGSLDEQKKYAVPTAHRATLIQDTCAVTYRTGTLTMRLAIGPDARALIDSTNVGDIEHQHFSHALWVRLPLKLTGNVPFRGQMHSYYHNVTTGETVRPNTVEYSLYKDAVLHCVVETDMLSPGPYTLTFEFDNTQAGVPKDQLIPMTPVKVTFTFEIKPAWAYR